MLGIMCSRYARQTDVWHLPCLFFCFFCFLGFWLVWFAPFLAAYDASGYRVRKGDTLYSLARRYGVSVEELMQANGLKDSADLQLDMLLRVPQKDKKQNEQYGKLSERQTTEEAKQGYGLHTVARGETYYSIAKSYEMELKDLFSLNKLDAGAPLRPGQVLTVSAAARRGLNGGRTRASEAEDSYFWPISGKREVLDGELQGVRILALDQSLVYAVQDGRVIWQGPYRSYGPVALLASADGHVYLYGGNVHFLVNIGQDVRTGEPLGKIDTGDQRYSGPAQLIATKKDYGQVYFSVFYKDAFVPVEAAPRGAG